MIAYRSIATGLAVAGVSAVAGAGLWEQVRPTPPQTTLMLATCGLVPAPDPLDLPLAMMLDQAGAPGLALGLALGPILHPGLDTPLSIRFAPLDPGIRPTPPPRQETDALVLPVVRDRLPDAIRLACRHGKVSEVRYRRGGTWKSMAVTPLPAADAPPPEDASPPDARVSDYRGGGAPGGDNDG